MITKVKRILLVEDDPKLSMLLKKSICQEGYAAEAILDLEELEQAMRGEHRFDSIVMDRIVGRVDMKTKIVALRRRWPDIPILIISAINTPMEKAELINLGADDYLGKPFYTEEFIARLRSMLRRPPKIERETRKVGRATLDLRNRRISAGQSFEDLSQKEFLILNALSENKKVMSRYELLEIVWGNANHVETNLVEATVTNLRRRLSSLDCGFEIKNRRNTGYWIEG